MLLMGRKKFGNWDGSLFQLKFFMSQILIGKENRPNFQIFPRPPGNIISK